MRNLFFLFLLCNINVLCAQTDSLSFPETWKGEYTGELKIYTGSGLQQSIPMELHILPIDSSTNYTWTIIYGEDKEAGKRDYELMCLDKEKGLYKIDEKNSILIEAYLFGETLIQRFEVMGTLLEVKTEKINDNQLSWTITSGKKDKTGTTGDTVQEGEEIPPVNAFSLSNMQKALLTKE